jgi:hypothetical protein
MGEPPSLEQVCYNQKAEYHSCHGWCISMSSLLSPTFLFRFATPCLHVPEFDWVNRTELDERYRLPCFAELEGKRSYADLRMGWHEKGVLVFVRVAGKQQSVWCRDSRIEDSDGLQIWLDTRDTKNVHRAGRFCHRFAIMPKGAGRNLDQPLVTLLAINRAKESPREIPERALQAKSRTFKDGYEVLAWIPAEALTGYDANEHTKVGFTYAVVDRELGLQTFSVGTEFPFTEDPSLWGTLELVRK